MPMTCKQHQTEVTATASHAGAPELRMRGCDEATFVLRVRTSRQAYLNEESTTTLSSV